MQYTLKLKIHFGCAILYLGIDFVFLCLLVLGHYVTGLFLAAENCVYEFVLEFLYFH